VNPKLFIQDPGPNFHFQLVSDSVSDLTFSLNKYDYKEPKMAFYNILLKEYLILVY
jgi:hypothetical protein